MKTTTIPFLVTLFLAFVLLNPAAAMDIHSGKVLMGQHTEKYTFILLEEGGEQKWLAANFIDIAPGDTIEYAGGIVMREFYSPAMKHTFDEILMVTNIRIAETVALPGDAEVASAPPVATEASPPATALKRGAGQLSIAELLANRDDLTGKRVSLRGKVIRVGGKIQGKTWVTLADGTGVSPDNQLTAATADPVHLGDTVTVTGTVRSDYTVGMGHTFKVLLDDARITP